MKQLNDQYFTYRQTPVDYDGVARPSIKGNTLVWNQLVKNARASVTGSGITFTNNNDGTWKLTGTATADVTYGVDVSGDRVNVVQGHKYYLRGCPSGGDDAKYYLELQGYARDKGTGVVFTAQSSSADVGVTLTVKNGVNLGTGVTFAPQLFDLTLNETNDLDTFTSLFPLQKYAYGQYLLNFNGSGIKTTGKNLWNNSIASVVGNVTKTDSGAVFGVFSSGVEILNFEIQDYGRPPFSDIDYTISFYAYADISGTALLFDGQPDALYNAYSGNALGKDKQLTLSTTKTRYTYSGIVLEGNTGFRFFRTTNSAYSSTSKIYIEDIQLEFGSTATDYEPYTSSTLSLPISTYFPTGMKSAGSVYDELSDKAITRIGAVDLGSLTWTYAGGRFQSTGLNGLIHDYTTLESPNITCAKYPTFIANYTSQTTFGITAFKDSGVMYLRVLDSAYSDSATFTTAMSGIYLNYELSTYTEQSAEDIYYNFYGNGTEQLLPVNTNTPTTSPLLADIIYYNLTDSEVPYRVFWAINSKGERWDFTEREFKSFMNNPQGLGFSKTISVNRYGNVQNLTDITDNFPQPNGEVLFYDSSNSTRYDKYNQFVKFLSYEPITLYYKIPVSFYSRIPNTYSLECVVGTLTKTESKTDNMMNCSITYNALSFYKGEEVEISGTGLTYTINNDGDFPVGFEIEINATYNFYMKNPYIQLSQDGSLYGEAKFIDDTRFNKVYINSKDGEQNVILQQSGSVLPNPMSYQDLSISNGSIYVTFVKLARGETTLTIGADSQNITDVTIKYTPIYRSV